LYTIILTSYLVSKKKYCVFDDDFDLAMLAKLYNSAKNMGGGSYEHFCGFLQVTCIIREILFCYPYFRFKVFQRSIELL